ncbi:MAG: restriction endonuclease subunit S [Pseudomonadota bacterium]
MSNLPSTWAVASLGELSLDCQQAVPKPDARITYIDISAIDRDRKVISSPQEMLGKDSPSRARKIVKTGDTLVSMTRPNLNSVAAVGQEYDGCVASTGFDVLRPNGVEPRWLSYLVRTASFVDEMSSLVQGALYPAVRSKDVRAHIVPVAPLAEQKRIADKLDTVLARVDACRDRLDRIPTILKRFRQSVLAAATSGQLTADWREKNSASPLLRTAKFGLPTGYKRLKKKSFVMRPVDHPAIELPASWTLFTVADLYEMGAIIDFADGNHGSLYPRSEDFDGKGTLFLTATQIDENWNVAIGDCPRLSNEKSRSLVKGWAKSGDVLLTHNATVGRVGLLENVEEDVLLGTSVTFYRLNEAAVSPRYLRLFFSSYFFQQQLASLMAQTTRDQVPITTQVSLNVICPPITEQMEVARRVETLFAFADRLEARVIAARESADRLTPALLAKAFRGELVPQDPNDEPAAELLKRLADSKNGEDKPKRGRKRA